MRSQSRSSRTPPGRTPAAAAAVESRSKRAGVRSSDAANIADILLRAPADARRRAFKEELSDRERAYVLREVERELNTPYGLWHDTPSGFVEDVCGESIWSKQREVMDAITRVHRVSVPAGFGVGKTHLAGRLVAWAGCVNPPGQMLIVTTATRLRQVRNQLWPHIRKVVARAGLPGHTDTLQWKMLNKWGVEVQVAYGFTAPPDDEAAMQGIHAPKLLIIVDEAGGIARTIGAGTNNLLTGGDSRLLAIGNPPANDPHSWFERLCEEGNDPEDTDTVTLPIAAIDSPAITGEHVPYCLDCPATPGDRHTLARHMPDDTWVNRTIAEYGPDHPYVQAKVYARFPRTGGGKVIPYSWIEAAQESEDPEGPGWVRLCDLGLEGETATHTVRMGSWIRLGVDVAADGGDEFAIARMVGDAIEHRHHSAGEANENQVNVATRILEEIEQAQRLADRLGTEAPIRVKIDKNGVGHGAVSMLQKWAESGRHQAEIVGVMVSESPFQDDPGSVMRPYRKRDEMWLATRSLLMPDPSTGFGRIRLRVDRSTAAQLSTPNLEHNAGGYAVVESKKKMRARGVKSPDRAEAALHCVYEPEPLNSRFGLLV